MHFRHAQLANRCEPWKITNGAEILSQHGTNGIDVEKRRAGTGSEALSEPIGIKWRE
jgi:hypothetical protein